jgi:hypothetical protein
MCSNENYMMMRKFNFIKNFLQFFKKTQKKVSQEEEEERIISFRYRHGT